MQQQLLCEGGGKERDRNKPDPITINAVIPLLSKLSLSMRTNPDSRHVKMGQSHRYLLSNAQHTNVAPHIPTQEVDKLFVLTYLLLNRLYKELLALL